MGCKRRFPFARVLPVGPRRTVRFPIRLDTLGKCLCVGSFERGGGTAGFADGDRVVALEQQRAAGTGLLACISERDGIHGAQPVIALAAGAVPENPPAALFVYGT